MDDEETTIEKERQLFKLIGTRRGKLGALTRQRNEINALSEAGDTTEEVEQQLRDFIRYLQEFEKLQESVQSLLSDEEKEHDPNDWYEPKMSQFKKFLMGVEFWLKVNEVQVDEHENETDVLQGACADSVSPHDSISQAATKPTSRVSSRGSSKASDALFKKFEFSTPY